MNISNLFIQLFTAFTPMILDAVKRYQDTHDGKFPTADEINVEFQANVVRVLSEGADWKANNPKPAA